MTVTSTSQPIALGTGTWQNGGGTVTITAPGFDATSGRRSQHRDSPRTAARWT